MLAFQHGSSIVQSWKNAYLRISLAAALDSYFCCTAFQLLKPIIIFTMLEGSKNTKSTNMLSHEQYWGHTWLIWVSFEWSILKQSSNCECWCYLYFNLPEASTAAFEMHSLPLVVSSITLARLKFTKFILLYFGNFMSCHVHFLKLLCIFSLYRSAIKTCQLQVFTVSLPKWKASWTEQYGKGLFFRHS